MGGHSNDCMTSLSIDVNVINVKIIIINVNKRVYSEKDSKRL